MSQLAEQLSPPNSAGSAFEDEANAVTAAAAAAASIVRDLSILNDKSYALHHLQQSHDTGCVTPVLRLTPQMHRRIYYEFLEYAPLLDSSCMDMRSWSRIADDICRFYDKYDGFLIIHGTDTMTYTGVIERRELIHRPTEIERFRVSGALDPNVCVIRIFPGITAQALRAFLAPPMRGAVLQTYGAGNAPDDRPELFEPFREATARGCLIINCTQCIHGNVTDSYKANEEYEQIRTALQPLLMCTAANRGDLVWLKELHVGDKLASTLTPAREAGNKVIQPLSHVR
ncbi:uncharacterized protein MONBRDRAFT_9831 [Monosiga brevicollis MX1]|uniref:asparaginase n=1 Tax=Monosiga brevicollis TaxID=81824 RepID=A9V4C9_MONBE|nr:uncharacterized protein MONBRDRAFT_9831 [Monosiga brevicollis MX1]EDQ87687.1 predicted protein [Monosiga brevicollis MX1]|eukprot:XP_001747607.1 hypothetical protein [Monosiga brevicollis MX1]